MDYAGLAATDERRVRLLVVGGRLAGTCAAVAAARAGVPLVLVQERPVLGGNTSIEIWVHGNGN